MAEQRKANSSIQQRLVEKIKPDVPSFEGDKRHAAASFIQLKYRLWQLSVRGGNGSTFKELERKKREEELQLIWRPLALIPPIMEFTLACLALSWRGHDGWLQEHFSDERRFGGRRNLHDHILFFFFFVFVVFFFFWLQTQMSPFFW
ncbi:hypothetical protein CYMTET_37284 [Cymbomonas tetramitiformis]|uniref:Uncharacterized protein n=1 Tax=Cymbomonas tetramitiformis TaxID=36881 RepID=A0AAE0F7M0_9CHLO|nr:hypothetical protein CYMTET_37284 [Cymbomonas tetramitiformis]